MRCPSRSDPLVETYIVLDTPLGAMALGGHQNKLRGVMLPRPDTHPDAAVSQLWPSAEPSRRTLPDLVARVRDYWRGRVRPIVADLDLAGFPPFYCAVWQAAMRIVPGQVRTYSELAAMAGRPKACRAVGGAMAANPFPLVVPCHRVVAAGSIGGFSAPGGLDLKESLLAWERRYTQ